MMWRGGARPSRADASTPTSPSRVPPAVSFRVSSPQGERHCPGGGWFRGTPCQSCGHLVGRSEDVVPPFRSCRLQRRAGCPRRLHRYPFAPADRAASEALSRAVGTSLEMGWTPLISDGLIPRRRASRFEDDESHGTRLVAGRVEPFVRSHHSMWHPFEDPLMPCRKRRDVGEHDPDGCVVSSRGTGRQRDAGALARFSHTSRDPPTIEALLHVRRPRPPCAGPSRRPDYAKPRRRLTRPVADPSCDAQGHSPRRMPAAFVMACGR